MRHIFLKSEKPEGTKSLKNPDPLEGTKRFLDRAVMAASAGLTYGMCQFNALAMTGLNKTYTIADTTNFNPESMILNLAFWISRLVGIGMLVWGIYGYVTARKDGEAESMNGALGKLISGCVLIAMPSVMKGLGILS